MGIRGLTRFMNENPQFLNSFELRDSFVVIDGSNFVYFLYFHNKINMHYGGDYNV